MAVGAGVLEALRGLFPEGVVPSPLGRPAQVEDQVRALLAEQARKALGRYKPRAGPGPNGSRFEHWGTVASDNVAWDAAAEVVVMFLLGECPQEALVANMGARLIALRKPNGKIRPVACGAVLRRLATRTVCAVFREDIRKACGEHQFAVGRRAGCEQVHKTITALTSARGDYAVLAFDATNAFNTMPRQQIVDAVAARLPAMTEVVRVLLGQPTTHLWWDGGVEGKPVRATKGVDQGCPLSPALFAIGLAGALDHISSRLHELDASARLFSYLDDVMVTVPAHLADQALAVVAEELQRAGLEINQSKTAIWTRDPSVALPDSVQMLKKPYLRCLGATAPWLDPDDDFARLTVHGYADGRAAVTAAESFVARLEELRKAGLGPKDAFLLLKSFSQGTVSHLLRANFEKHAWVDAWDWVIMDELERLVTDILSPDQKAQAYLRLFG